MKFIEIKSKNLSWILLPRMTLIYTSYIFVTNTKDINFFIQEKNFEQKRDEL